MFPSSCLQYALYLQQALVYPPAVPQGWAPLELPTLILCVIIALTPIDIYIYFFLIRKLLRDKIATQLES